jgi:hypothetical protein
MFSQLYAKRKRNWLRLTKLGLEKSVKGIVKITIEQAIKIQKKYQISKSKKNLPKTKKNILCLYFGFRKKAGSITLLRSYSLYYMPK